MKRFDILCSYDLHWKDLDLTRHMSVVIVTSVDWHLTHKFEFCGTVIVIPLPVWPKVGTSLLFSCVVGFKYSPVRESLKKSIWHISSVLPVGGGSCFGKVNTRTRYMIRNTRKEIDQAPYAIRTCTLTPIQSKDLKTHNILKKMCPLSSRYRAPFSHLKNTLAVKVCTLSD